jgi:outer membrane protein OmpA-like peptidoglycan-associated protein
MHLLLLLDGGGRDEEDEMISRRRSGEPAVHASCTHRVRRIATACLALALLSQSGCGVVQRPGWNKPWGKGTWIPALVCGAIGAGVGVAIQNERPGCSTLTIDGRTFQDCDDEELWKGAVIGAPVGAVLCALLGHVFLDPAPYIEEPPPPPPPPPTPEPTPLPLVKRRIVLRGVNFDFDRADIRPDSRPILDQAVAILHENPGVLVVAEGHTDALGSEEYNEALSIRRAEAVFRYLVNRGIAPERLRVEGFGESRPVATNDTEVGRAQNRRVELRVLP